MKSSQGFTLLLLLLASIQLLGQNVWVGTFTGSVNGDPTTLILESNGPNKVVGKLKDSYQNFEVNGETSGNRMAGDAKEKSLGLTFALLGELNGSTAEMKLVIEFLGQTSETPFTLTKQGAVASGKTKASTSNSKLTYSQLPVGATLDPKLVGKWTKNETYNSGYGDNFMGANFSQSMFFKADGTLAEGNSSASMSGSNYSGRSQGGGGSDLEGIRWYTKGKNLYLSIEQNGQKQAVLLGTYYIENSNMLITGTNGEKLLLSR